MEFCERCNEYITACGDNNNKCNCKPYTILYDDEIYEKYGKSIDAAARLFAAYYNRDDYSLMDEEIEIEIIDSDNVKHKYAVGAEPDIRYWSKEL